MRRIGSKLTFAVIGVALVAVLIGSYALSAQNTFLPVIFRKPAVPGPIIAGPSDLTLTLTLDRTSYQAGGTANVTVTIKNTGTRQAIIGRPDQVGVQLIVFDGNMNPIGTWGSEFRKVPMMHPPDSGTILLGPGEAYSWTFQWDLGVYTTTGTIHYQALSSGSYNAQSKVAINSSSGSIEQMPDLGGITLTSAVVQFSVT